MLRKQRSRYVLYGPRSRSVSTSVKKPRKTNEQYSHSWHDNLVTISANERVSIGNQIMFRGEVFEPTTRLHVANPLEPVV